MYGLQENPGPWTKARRPPRSPQFNRVGIVLVIFAILYFAFFVSMTKRGIRSWFSGDDLANLYYATSHPLRELIAGNIVFFGHFPRPLGELVYYTVYYAFGFNPAGFNAVRLILCAVNVFVLYCFARRLSGSRETGAVAVLLGGFHPALLYMYYDTGMIHDALAFLFFYGAFWFYLYCRRGGRWPGAGQILLVLTLYVAALDSKEISVSFPVALFLYELTQFTPPIRLRGLFRQFGTALTAGIFTSAYIIDELRAPRH
jgi:hypothetical protein